jgi:hypothetical protein
LTSPRSTSRRGDAFYYASSNVLLLYYPTANCSVGCLGACINYGGALVGRQGRDYAGFLAGICTSNLSTSYLRNFKRAVLWFLLFQSLDYGHRRDSVLNLVRCQVLQVFAAVNFRMRCQVQMVFPMFY